MTVLVMVVIAVVVLMTIVLMVNHYVPTLLFKINKELAHSVLTECFLNRPGITIEFPLSYLFQEEQLKSESFIHF